MLTIFFLPKPPPLPHKKCTPSERDKYFQNIGFVSKPYSLKQDSSCTSAKSLVTMRLIYVFVPQHRECHRGENKGLGHNKTYR